MMSINAIGILGANSIGTGIAELFALNGFQVRIYDNFKDSLTLAMAKIKWSFAKQGKAELFDSIEPVQDFSLFKGADIIIEAVGKGMDERRMIFNKLASNVNPECIVAVYSGVIPLEEILESSDLPAEQTVGFHFIKPVKKNQLVELIKTDKTKEEIIEVCMELLRKAKKTPIMVKDNPGAVVERLLRPFFLSAFRLLESGKGLPHEIDEAFKEVSKAAYGPFEMVDYMGLDSDYEATKQIYEKLGSPDRLIPSEMELRLVQYGQLGRNSTIGFYIYEDGKIVGENPILSNIVKYLGLKKVGKEEIFSELLRPVVEEAKLLASEIMASEYDIETAVKIAFNWPKGPFAYYRENAALFKKKVVSEFDNLDSF
ncbi:MAG: 3-hydroxyacyl-CoA dehydrogenase family protein [Elusimicrobiota bacterium]|nr:3-hydroxyacyl-CoA dehydrogenase family protein [Elusimicrobiota bacterium]